MDEMIKLAEDNLLHVYNRFPVVFEEGKGTYLYDVNGKEYLDFGSGIGVMAFGYGDNEFEDAIISQVKKLLHTSNLYYHTALPKAAEALARVSGLKKVFFTNSGAESIEGAIKAAKKYAFNRDGHADHEIIAAQHSFHGRTVGAVAVTGTDHYRDPFYPLMPGVRFGTYNDLDSFREQVNEKTCAIIVETVQGEGGIRPAEPEFLKGVRELCDEKDILLILDEVQCGMGRCGSMYTFMQYGVTPDILCTAKALGGGIPVGAFVVNEKVAERSLEPGDHGTTYGGNALACAAVAASISIMENRNLPQHVKDKAAYFEDILEGFVAKYDFIHERRGLGFMQGLEIDERIPVGKIVSAALDEGLILLSAGGNVLRMLPPLVTGKEQFDKMQTILDKVFVNFS